MPLGMLIGTGNGVQTVFPMPNNSQLMIAGSDPSLVVYVGGTYNNELNKFVGGAQQTNGTNYNVVGYNLVFLSAVNAGFPVYGDFVTLDRGN